MKKRRVQYNYALECEPPTDVLYCVVGKSGSGKNYFCEQMGLINLPSYTTRPKRIEEYDGHEHFFVKREVFEKVRSSKNFSQAVVAWTEFHGNFYWATLDMINKSKYKVYIVDPRGVEDIAAYTRKYHGRLNRDIRLIYIECPWYKRFVRMFRRDVLSGWDWKKETTEVVSLRDGDWSFYHEGSNLWLKINALWRFVGFSCSGAKKVLSRMNHDRKVFAYFLKKYEIDYKIKG